MAKTRPSTFGELKKSGYKPRSVNDELRSNLMAKLERSRTLKSLKRSLESK